MDELKGLGKDHELNKPKEIDNPKKLRKSINPERRGTKRPKSKNSEKTRLTEPTKGGGI